MEALRYFDAHAHMSWYENPAAAMRACEAVELSGICCTVNAEDYEGLAARGTRDTQIGEPSKRPGTWRVAAGLHPWWAKGADLEAAVELARCSPYVGEIGLDLGKRHAHTADAQLRAFEAICAAAPDGAVLSIHSIVAAGAVLDALTRTGAAARCRCVFHWFSGTSSELDRARKAGCWFSLGERSLATRRGREYARQIPAERLLTETDLPADPGSPVDAAAHLASIQRAVEGVAQARGADAEETRALVLVSSLKLLC